MRPSREQIAARGEDFAARALEARGWEVLHRNLEIGRGEVDILAKDRGCLVFVEVKARLSTEFGSPAEAVTRGKQRQLVRLATQYLAAHQLHDQDCRLDVAEVEMDANGKLVRFELLENAFQADGMSFF